MSARTDDLRFDFLPMPPGGVGVGAFHGDRRVGGLDLVTDGAEWADVINVNVDRRWRRRGIARHMLDVFHAEYPSVIVHHLTGRHSAYGVTWANSLPSGWNVIDPKAEVRRAMGQS